MLNVMKPRLSGKKLLFVLFTLFTLSAFGQGAEPAIEREGFVIGFGIGGGVISVSDSNQEVPFDKASGGISLPNLKIGWMLSERMALLATFPGMIYEYEGRDRSFEAFIPSLQYWPSSRWWVNGGIGLAMDFPAFYEVDDFKDEDWNFGCAVAAGTGYEIVQKKNFALDIQSKIHLGRAFLGNDQHRDGAAFTLGLGFNWY